MATTRVFDRNCVSPGKGEEWFISLLRVLPDEWNGVTEVELPAGDRDREKLGNGS